VRADLGIGALFLSGVTESPFTNDSPTTGTLTMFHVRAGASVEFAITHRLTATIAPLSVSYSPPRAGMRTDIRAFDAMLGLGYRR
jgi:hypothetical protein